MNRHGHDTREMRNWAGTMNTNADDYDSLVNRLYALIDGFVGSEQFRGGLSADFLQKVASQKSTFLRYSETFRDFADLINSRAGINDSKQQDLEARINRANPLDF